jgi:hypothetical protein
MKQYKSLLTPPTFKMLVFNTHKEAATMRATIQAQYGFKPHIFHPRNDPTYTIVVSKGLALS